LLYKSSFIIWKNKFTFRNSYCNYRVQNEKGTNIDAIDIGFILNLNEIKCLIKQKGFYYNIKSEQYDSTVKTFLPIQLEGEIDPNINDIMNYGFNDVRNIYNNMTVNNNIFRPIDKLYDRFEIKKYSL